MLRITDDTELARRARAIFRATLEHDSGERQAFLDQVCDGDELRAEVESLLEYDGKEHATFLDGSLKREMMSDHPVGEVVGLFDDGPAPGSRIGHWRISRRLGQGGMGTVYLVVRADGSFDQRAALKLIQPGVWSQDMVRRFEAERQILAHLRHPNIARLLDGGTTAGGRPYLVMELVEGRPIDRYCDQEQLSIDQRLELFGQVCRAVQYAHRALVVHRDLKPSNVVVDAGGHVTLLDFGIASALSPDGTPAGAPTRTMARIMTPDYASPEQVLGLAVNTAADVYQLGLLLFELLIGQRAQRIEDPSPAALERVICETPIAPPSAVITAADVEPARVRCSTPLALARRLSGDLDSIVAMAVRKEPERRYGSVAQLAEDIGRHLGGQPVDARPDSLGYRLRRFAGRHRQALAWGALCLALLVWLVIGAARDRVRSLREGERVRQIEAVIGSLFEYPRVTDSGRSPQLSDFLDQAAELIRRDLRDQPGSQVRLLTRLGRTYSASGSYQKSAAVFQEALALAGSLGDQSGRTELLFLLARSQHFQGLFAAAEANFRAAAALREEILGDGDPRTIAAQLELADLLHSLGRLREAEQVIEGAMLSLPTAGEAREVVDLRIRADGYLANVWRDRGGYDRAEVAYRSAIAGALELHGSRDVLVASNTIYLARLLVIRGRLDEAERRLEEVLEILREVHFGDHPLMAIALRELVFAAIERGQLELAAARLVRARTISLDWLDVEHPTIARVTALQAELERRRGRIAESVAVSKAALDHFARFGLHGHPSAIDTCITLGLATQALGGSVEPWVATRLRDCLAAAEVELVAGDPRTERLRELTPRAELEPMPPSR